MMEESLDAEIVTSEDGALSKLHPDHVKASRVAAAITMAVLLMPIGLLEILLFNADMPSPPVGLFALAWLILALYYVIRVPRRRYDAAGYQMGSDRLRIIRGVLFRSDTIVPFGRIQHIDVDQGPIERRYGLGTISVHTAGNHNSTVVLPGLLHSDAIAMREAMRAHIKRETI